MPDRQFNFAAKFAQLLLAIVSIFFLNALALEARNPLVVEQYTGKSKEKYTLIRLNDARMRFVVSPPNEKDLETVLVTPVAFTKTDGNISGVYIDNGTIHNGNSVGSRLGGSLIVTADGDCRIIDTRGGTVLSKAFLDQLASKKSSLVQQFSIVKNGQPSTFKGKDKAKRRGIGILKDGTAVVVESKGLITLSQFCSDMVGVGTKDMVYADMGGWGEAWYRDPGNGKVVILGVNHPPIVKQTNWVVVSGEKAKD